MKKLVLGLAVVAALGLSGCGGGETIEDARQSVVDNGSAIVASARIVFDPANGLLSIPNDLLFSGTLDGTLNIPGAGADGSDPVFALNALDGWSTGNPFLLAVDFPAGTSFNVDTVSDPASVRIFETIMGGDADPDCTSVQRGFACKVVGELTFGVDFVTQAKGNSIAVVPLKPLKGKTSYILALTNNLRDSNAKVILGSETYEFVRQDITTSPLGSEAQLGLQAVVNSYENAIVNAGADRDTITYTMAMTTQSTTDMLFTVKALMAAQAGQGVVPTIGIHDTGLSVANILAGIIPESLIPLYSTANFMQGTITLPYYLPMPTEENPLAPVNGWIKSLCDSGAMLAGYAAGGGTIPAEPVSVADGTCMAISAANNLPYPGLRDLGIDTERHITKFSPVPATTAMVDVVVQMTTPDLNMTNAVRAGLGLGPITEPANGWPVVILEHGITSKKEDMLALTGIFSLYGLATVAINHPLHGDPDAFGGAPGLMAGSRGFDLDGDGVDEINTSTVSATHYMNLGSLLSTRDNLRQSTADLLGLRLGMNFLSGSEFVGDGTKAINIDTSKVHFIGHSLGAITGMNFMALTNSALAPQVDPLFAVMTNSLAMPDVMVAASLMESGAFGDLIKSGLTYAKSEDFQGYVAQVHPGPADPTTPELIGYYQDFYALLTPEQQGTLEGIFAQFSFAAQTVTDAGDPINYVGLMVAQNKPTHLIEIAGNDDGINLSDQTLPNWVTSSPLSGGEATISLLGLPGVSDTVQDAEMGISGAVRYLFGHHGSILDPSPRPEGSDMTVEVTTEMQRQVADFFASEGHVISVLNNAVVK